MTRKLLSFFLSFFLFSIVFQKVVLASVPKGSLEVSPAFTEVVLDKASDSKKIVFTYKNNSSRPITLDIFPIDFKQSDLTGTVDFLGTEAGSFSYSLSSYLSFEANTLQLDPGVKKDFVVTINNREDLSPGGHYAAVVARLRQDFGGQSPLPKTGSEGPNNTTNLPQVAPSVSALILLRKVGGERFNLSLSALDFPKNPLIFGYPQTIVATFENEGNIHVVPFGDAQVKDIFGRVIYRGVINTGSLRVFPESRRYIDIDMQQTAWSFPVSVNTILVSGQDSLQKTTFRYKDTFIYINPWFVILLSIGVIVGLWFKRRKAKPTLLSKQKHKKKKK